jgi:hypothetical protein
MSRINSSTAAAKAPSERVVRDIRRATLAISGFRQQLGQR